jgi:hypothetical protein
MILLLTDDKVLKAYVLCRSPTPGLKEDGIKEAKNLINMTPAITDVETLRLLGDAVDHAGADVQLMTLMWDRAVKAKPNDERLAKEWFLVAFQSKNWKGAQQVWCQWHSLSLQLENL